MNKVNLYCQIGSALDLAEFAIESAIRNAGDVEFGLFFICWKTSSEVYEWLRKNKYRYIDMQYDEGKGFIWNLYKGWNLGYEEGFKTAEYVCPIATDHAFYKNWLSNLMKHALPNRIVNCKLIEPGTLPTLHTAKNFGITTKENFKQSEFEAYCSTIYREELITDDVAYGRRLDAMPFVCPKDVWNKIGPMNKTLIDGHITGDTDFFDRAKKSGIEITKSLSSISYHCGGLETERNRIKKIYG